MLEQQTMACDRGDEAGLDSVVGMAAYCSCLRFEVWRERFIDEDFEQGSGTMCTDQKDVA